MVSVVRSSRGGGSAAFCSGLTIIKLCWAAAAILLVAMHRHFLNSTGETKNTADDAYTGSDAAASYSDADSGNEMSAFQEKNRKFHEKKRTPAENVVPVPYGTAPASAAAAPPPPPAAAKEATGNDNNNDWCGQVKKARSDLDKELHITVPCDTMKPAKSAIVCYLTAGVPDGQGNHKVFTGTDYINGALALGASLQDHVTRDDVHRLLLVRDGFSIPDDKRAMLEAVGWTLGKAPKVEVDQKYIPRYERYKTLYTKISVIGLAEYDCVLLLDADALTVGNIDDLMSCKILEPNYRVAGTLDYYHGQWYHFNTGSALWRPSSQEMNRVYGMTKDSSWMRRFESDQIFTNTVYEDRTNRTLNAMILSGEVGKEAWGQVADMGWAYNAQTHVENQLSDYWEEHLKEVKIIHFTHAKGWQCPERHGGPPEPKQTFPRNPERCKNTPGCACNEGYRWYDYLDIARERGNATAKR